MCEKFHLISDGEYTRLLQLASEKSGLSAEKIARAPTVAAPESLLELLPPKLQIPAKQLLAALKQRYDSSILDFDLETGLVTIDGQQINRSNITDLLTALLQPLSTRKVPGLSELTALFKRTNFPLLLVRNKRIRDTLSAESGLDTLVDSKPKITWVSFGK